MHVSVQSPFLQDEVIAAQLKMQGLFQELHTHAQAARESKKNCQQCKFYVNITTDEIILLLTQDVIADY